MMKLLILLLFIIAAMLIRLWLMKTGNRSENESPVYGCPECGDHHCTVILKKRISEG